MIEFIGAAIGVIAVVVSGVLADRIGRLLLRVTAAIAAFSGFAPHLLDGSALTSDLAWLFGAGFAPFVALFLSTRFGLLSSGAYLLSGAIGTLVALSLDRRTMDPDA